MKTCGITVMMLVNYKQSPIGPYDELLLIPGKIKIGGRSGYSISHIQVSTDISTKNGRKHWGIPKETSTFSSEISNQMIESQIEDQNGKTSSIVARSTGIKIPVMTHLLPYILLQSTGEKVCTLRPTATGITKLAQLESFASNQQGFEKLTGKKPLIGFHATSFNMKFPAGRWG